MKKLLLSIFLLTAIGMYGQQSSVLKGKVVDMEAANEPLLFAKVLVKGTSFKAETNFNGNFEFSSLPPGNYTVSVSYLGYDTREFRIALKADEVTRMDLPIRAKSLDLDDVLKVGDKVSTTAEGTATRKEL